MTSLDAEQLEALHTDLADAQLQHAARFPVDSGARQPVHVVYGGAHLFKAETTQKLGALARAALDTWAPDAASLAEALAIELGVAARVYPRLQEKLAREPVEDFRVDFEDGYGHRGDAEEDAAALHVAAEVAKAMGAGGLPAFFGLRVKPMSAELGVRGARTLDLFLTALVKATHGALPSGFVVTLPKVVSAAQVAAFVRVLEALEGKLGLPAGALRLEVMVESAQGLLDASGRAVLPQVHAAAQGRLRGAHFGAYDYTASLEVTAAVQTLRHPACDLARFEMKRAFAGTGVFLSDGATTLMPVPVHRGEGLTPQQQEENRRAVHAAWRQSADDLRHALLHGFYQGWDLHPAQLVARYGAVFAFFLSALQPATTRLKNFVDGLGQATLSGDVFDDAATGQGLLNFFLRGRACGALTEAEALAAGLSADELASRSFALVAKHRRKS